MYLKTESINKEYLKQIVIVLHSLELLIQYLITIILGGITLK